MSESEATGADLTPAERADAAAQSLHSAELDGGSVTPATREDTERYVAGESTAQELQRVVRDRYGVHSEGESKREAPAFASVHAAAHAFAAGLLTNDEFITAVVAFPIMKQTPMPTTPFWDAWPRKYSPVSEVQDALSHGLISIELYDSAVTAMGEGGHEA